MTWERLRREMSLKEYRLWVEAYNREPWGDTRADWQMAQVCSTISAANGVKSSPSDFMPNFDREEKQQTSEDHKWIFQKWAAWMNRGK